MRKILVMGFAFLGCITESQAQTCSSPIPVKLFVSGDTCAAENPFPVYPGGIPSPQNDVVYSFSKAQMAETG